MEGKAGPGGRPTNAGGLRKRLRLIAASVSKKSCQTAYCAAILPARWAARSRSMTVRQPLERLERLLIMQAVIFEMFGISELHSRNASLVHIDCASALKAKLEVDETAQIEAATASAKPALRMVLVKVAVMFGSRWFGDANPLFDVPTMRLMQRSDCDPYHSAASPHFCWPNGSVLGRR